MKKAFSARRVPRKIGSVDDEEGLQQEQEQSGAGVGADSAIKRPSSKSRKSTSLRQSRGPSAVDQDEDDALASVVTPKRKNLSRIAVHKNAASKRSSLIASRLLQQHSPRPDDSDDRPSYSAASLQELKASTPSTPKDISTTASDVESVASSTQALDLSSKFGSSLSRYQQNQRSSIIPSAAEIAEKKARRARLAKEEQAEEYISLDPDDPTLDEEDLDDNVMRDERGKLVLKPKDKYGLSESRLVHEDEDIMEHFDEFTDDGRIALGRKAELEAARKRKLDMAAQIAEAEGASDADSDDSEKEQNEEFEAAQTKHGSYVRAPSHPDSADQRPRTPPVITPLPTLEEVIGRLRKQLADMQSSQMRKLQDIEALQREKIKLAEDEVRIQASLKETAEKFEKLRSDRGIRVAEPRQLPAIEAPSAASVNGGINSTEQEATDEGSKMHELANDSDEVEEVDERPAFGGLGFEAARSDPARSGLGFRPSSDD